jgi:hypothetical protein
VLDLCDPYTVVSDGLSFPLIYVSGTQLMTPERRKAVWAIYGMEKLKILLITVDLG